MRNIPKISDTEWEVMRVVWRRHPTTAAEIIAQLTALDPSWHPKTVRTLLARLVEKGALAYVAQGKTYSYRPLATEEQCVAAASGSFLQRVFGGALQPMLVHFIEQRRLSQKDLDELRAILEAPSEDKAVGKNDENPGPTRAARKSLSKKNLNTSKDEPH